MVNEFVFHFKILFFYETSYFNVLAFSIQNLIAVPSFNSIDIRWTLPTNTTGLLNFILNITPNNQQFQLLPNSTAYTFSNLVEATRYTITVKQSLI